MISKNIVIDTSVIVEYIRANKGMLLELVKLARNKEIKLHIPTIVLSELWCGRSMNKKSTEKKVERLISVMKYTPLSRQTAKEAGNLIRKGMVDGLIDAVIAATALELNAQLATQNVKHFKNVDGLKLFMA